MPVLVLPGLGDSGRELVGHSLACALVARWAKRFGRGVKAALLVSPSDVDSPAHTPAEVRSFSPLPLVQLSFPSIVVASTDDTYVDLERALGEWREGKNLLQELRRATVAPGPCGD